MVTIMTNPCTDILTIAQHLIILFDYSRLVNYSTSQLVMELSHVDFKE